jgi:hypothetical protein
MMLYYNIVASISLVTIYYYIRQPSNANIGQPKTVVLGGWRRI